MEIILISECKLKIALREEDLAAFEIRADELDYSNTETKRMFWDLLTRAKQKTGFDTDGQRVLVQLYPSKDGGCEMFVTKIGLLDEERSEKEEKHDKKCSQGYERLSSQIKKQKRNAAQRGICSAYSFDNTENLLRVCRRLSDMGYIGDSSAYKGDNGRCYLFLADVETASYTPLDEFSFIAEYGRKENSDLSRYYVLEHSKPLCEKSAVSTLGKF